MPAVAVTHARKSTSGGTASIGGIKGVLSKPFLAQEGGIDTDNAHSWTYSVVDPLRMIPTEVPLCAVLHWVEEVGEAEAEATKWARTELAVSRGPAAGCTPLQVCSNALKLTQLISASGTECKIALAVAMPSVFGDGCICLPSLKVPSANL